MRQPSPCLALQLPCALLGLTLLGQHPEATTGHHTPPNTHGWYPDSSPQVYHAGDRWAPQGLLSSSQTPIPASSQTTCAAHLFFKVCQLVLGFASSRSHLFFFFPLRMKVLGNLWVMDSRLGESWMVRPESLAFQPHPRESPRPLKGPRWGRILASKEVDCHLHPSGSQLCDPGQLTSSPSL